MEKNNNINPDSMIPMYKQIVNLLNEKIENAKKDLGYKPEFSYIRYLEDYKKEQKLNRFAELWRK